MSSPTNQSIAIECARAFAEALVGGDFAGAQALLSPAYGALEDVDRLTENYTSMFRSWVDETAAAKTVDIDPEFALISWPTMARSDFASVYVSITGTQLVEAVTVVVEHGNTAPVIRDVTWGRP
jgi:hypothetical protein